jgi:hypothetical protein
VYLSEDLRNKILFLLSVYATCFHSESDVTSLLEVNIFTENSGSSKPGRFAKECLKPNILIADFVSTNLGRL